MGTPAARLRVRPPHRSISPGRQWPGAKPSPTCAPLLLHGTADNTAAADFIGIAIPRLKVGGAAKNDSEGGLVQTLPFQALLNVNGGTGIATERPTICIQDAQA
jgi:hypothetical protein